MTAQPALFDLDPSFRPANPEVPDLNEAYTPQPIFDVWNRVLKFTVDAFSCAAAKKLDRYWTKEIDAFKQDWSGERVFVQNPYTDMYRTAAKVDHAMRTGCELACALWPGDRAEQPFWKEFVEPYRDRGRARFITLRERCIFGRPLYVDTINIFGRIAFEGPAATSGGGRFPSVLVLWHSSHKDFLALESAENERTSKERT